MTYDYSGAEVTETALEEVAADFKDNPVDFFLESDIQSRLYETVRRILRENDELRYPPNVFENTVRIAEETVGAGSYDDWFAEYTNSKPVKDCHLTRVHTETWLSEEWDYSNDNKLDMVVLDYPGYRPVQLFKGRRRIEESAIGAAIELKYLARDAAFPRLPRSVDAKSASVDSLANDIKLDSSGIEKDLKSLQKISEGHKRESYFVLATMYDPLCRGEHAKRHLSNAQVKEKTGDALVQLVRDEFPKVNFLYLYPDGKEWLNRARE
jgi:hypothetical protein